MPDKREKPTPLPRVGEVWGEPNDPFTWHLVELANEYSVVCWTFKGPQLVKGPPERKD